MHTIIYIYIYIYIFQVICHFWPLLKSVMKIPVCHSDYFLRLISCKWKLWVCILLIFMAYITTFFRKIIPVCFSSLRVCEICVSLHSCQYLVVSFFKETLKMFDILRNKHGISFCFAFLISNVQLLSQLNWPSVCSFVNCLCLCILHLTDLEITFIFNYFWL